MASSGAPASAGSVGSADWADSTVLPKSAAQLLDLPYEKIQPVADYATPYPYLACGFDGSETAYYTMCRDGLWGFIDADGAEAVPCRYEYACPTPDGRALVRENGVWSIAEPTALAA